MTRALTPDERATRRCRVCRERVPPKGWVCATCQARRRRGYQPLWHGPCLGNCGRPGRGRSGYCEKCYQNILRRELSHRRAFRAAGHPIPRFDFLVVALEQWQTQTAEQAEGREAVLAVLRLVQSGEFVIQRNGRRYKQALKGATHE